MKKLGIIFLTSLLAACGGSDNSNKPEIENFNTQTEIIGQINDSLYLMSEDYQTVYSVNLITNTIENGFHISDLPNSNQFDNTFTISILNNQFIFSRTKNDTSEFWLSHQDISKAKYFAEGVYEGFPGDQTKYTISSFLDGVLFETSDFGSTSSYSFVSESNFANKNFLDTLGEPSKYIETIDNNAYFYGYDNVEEQHNLVFVTEQENIIVNSFQSEYISQNPFDIISSKDHIHYYLKDGFDFNDNDQIWSFDTSLNSQKVVFESEVGGNITYAQIEQGIFISESNSFEDFFYEYSTDSLIPLDKINNNYDYKQVEYFTNNKAHIIAIATNQSEKHFFYYDVSEHQFIKIENKTEIELTNQHFSYSVAKTQNRIYFAPHEDNLVYFDANSMAMKLVQLPESNSFIQITDFYAVKNSVYFTAQGVWSITDSQSEFIKL